MSYIKGRAIRIEVGIIEGAAKEVSAVSKADPGVATSTGHGLSAKSVGYFANVSGMTELEGRAARLAAVDTNTMTLEDLDTTRFGTFAEGDFIPVTAWATLSQATEYTIGGGEADQLDTTTLLDDEKQVENGQLAAETVSFNIRAQDVANTALAYVRKQARSGGYIVFRITLQSGAVRVWRGQPGKPGESVAASAVGSGSFTSTVKGGIVYGEP